MKSRDYTRDALVLRALANENRLKIVERISSEEACVCELTEMLGLDQSTVSKHLTLLKTAGIVSGVRRGNHVYYHLQAPCVLSFLDCAAAVRDYGDTGEEPAVETGTTGGCVDG